MPFRDQRVMVGLATLTPDGRVAVIPEPGHQTTADVRAAWEAWGRHMGFEMRRRRGDQSTRLRRSTRTLAAYVSGMSWVADCPECGDAAAGWPDHQEGCCLGCGTIYPLAYPPAGEIREAEEILAVRPRENATWRPDLGETVAFLKGENVTRGLGLSVGQHAAQEANLIARILTREGPEAEALLRRLGAI